MPSIECLCFCHCFCPSLCPRLCLFLFVFLVVNVLVLLIVVSDKVGHMRLGEVSKYLDSKNMKLIFSNQKYIFFAGFTDIFLFFYRSHIIEYFIHQYCIRYYTVFRGNFLVIFQYFLWSVLFKALPFFAMPLPVKENCKKLKRKKSNIQITTKDFLIFFQNIWTDFPSKRTIIQSEPVCKRRFNAEFLAFSFCNF